MAQEIRIQANGRKEAKNLSFLFNGSKRGNMAHRSTKKKKKKSHRPNPFYNRGRRGKRHGHNPFREKRMGKGGTIETVLGAVAATVLPDLIESNFLVQFNSGFMGYIADAVLGGTIMWAGGKFVGRGFADGALAGITTKISMRALQDMGSSAPNAIHANIRDAQAQAAANPAPPAPPQPMQGVGRPGVWKFAVPNSYPQLPGGGYGQTVSLGSPQRQLRRRA